MNRQSLVSVMVPSHDAARTLPRALASLSAQTWTAWECVLIDDGSTDGTREILRRLDDSRIRVERLPARRGRGGARQRALELCRGEFLCMLDADDWMYPDRIERQVALLVQDPDAVLVTSTAAIVDRRNRIIGIREPRGRGIPPGPFAASMVRTSAAWDAGFNTSLQVGEDADFLRRLLDGRRHIVDRTAVYAYAEYGSFDPEKTLATLDAVRRGFAKRAATKPIEAIAGISVTTAKMLWYRGAFGLGLGDRVLNRRWRSPSPAELRRYEIAARRVTEVERATAWLPAS